MFFKHQLKHQQTETKVWFRTWEEAFIPWKSVHRYASPLPYEKLARLPTSHLFTCLYDEQSQGAAASLSAVDTIFLRQNIAPFKSALVFTFKQTVSQFHVCHFE